MAEQATQTPALPRERSVGEAFSNFVSATRLVAIVAVVVVHTAGPLVTAWRREPALLWHFGNLSLSAAKFCVPVFVMLSGALLLEDRRGETVAGFYRRRAARLLVPLVVWTIFYIWFTEQTSPYPYSSANAIWAVAAGRPYYHLFFLYVIGGLYLVTPYLRDFVRAAASRRIIHATVLCLALAVTDWAVSIVIGFRSPDLVSRFVPYIGYFLAGYVLSRIARPSRRGACRLLIVWVAATISVAGLSWWLFGNHGPSSQGRVMYEYFSLPVVVASCAAFLLLRWAFERPLASAETARRLRGLADLTFGVFLMHPVLLTWLQVEGPSATASRAGILIVLLQSVIVLAASAALVWILRQVPFARRLV